MARMQSQTAPAQRQPAAPPIFVVAADQVTAVVRDLCIRANLELSPDVVRAYERALERERSPIGRDVLQQLLENARLAATERLPYCQDTGMAVVFVRKGARVVLSEGTLQTAIDEGVRQAYRDAFLRKSVIASPLDRRNTGDNTPAIVHLEEDESDELAIAVMPKGFGGENTSRLSMLPPSAGWEGVVREVVETVRRAGPNACPPVVVGVGLGGDFEQAPLLAKKALLREVGQAHPDPAIARREEELLEAVNALGLGPQGLGGTVTAVGVHIEVAPTHIAALPVAVNMGCNAYRHRSAVLKGAPLGRA